MSNREYICSVAAVWGVNPAVSACGWLLRRLVTIPVIVVVVVPGLAGSMRPEENPKPLHCRLLVELDRQPAIGDYLCGLPQNPDRIAVSPAQMAILYNGRTDSMEYSIGTDDRGRIIFIRTTEPSFVSPEGVKIGTTVSQLLSDAKLRVTEETGWAWYVPLPSGWNAQLMSPESDTDPLGGLAAFIPDGRHPLPENAIVGALFKRGR